MKNMKTQCPLDKVLTGMQSLMRRSRLKGCNSTSGFSFSIIFRLSGRLTVGLYTPTHSLVFVYLASGDDPYFNMRKDLDMTDERYALVKGTIFTLINSIFGLLFGYLADSFNRKWILVITTIAYTLMTLASAYVHTFV